MPSSVPIRTLRMEEELYLKLKYIAKIEGRSYNQETIYILKNFVAQYELKHGKFKNN